MTLNPHNLVHHHLSTCLVLLSMPQLSLVVPPTTTKNHRWQQLPSPLKTSQADLRLVQPAAAAASFFFDLFTKSCAATYNDKNKIQPQTPGAPYSPFSLSCSCVQCRSSCVLFRQHLSRSLMTFTTNNSITGKQHTPHIDKSRVIVILCMLS